MRVKPPEKQGPPSQVKIESTCGTEIRKVSVVCPNNKWVYCTFKPVSPLLEGENDHEEFPVPHIVISFHGVETLGEKGTRMELLVYWGALTEDGLNSRIRVIHLNPKCS